MASCLLSSPRIHSPPDSLMRRTSVTKVSENRVFQQAVRTPRDSRLLFPIIGSETTILKNKETQNSPSIVLMSSARRSGDQCCHLISTRLRRRALLAQFVEESCYPTRAATFWHI